MRSVALASIAVAALFVIVGCDERSATGPPSVRLGDSVCAQCNMIISDERWATATIIEGPRGGEPRLFDDFNCQVAFESEHPDTAALARWSHSFTTSEWIQTQNAYFLMSPNLRTPMGSQVAAFATQAELDGARRELTGNEMTFDGAWRHLSRAHTTNADSSNEGDTP